MTKLYLMRLKERLIGCFRAVRNLARRITAWLNSLSGRETKMSAPQTEYEYTYIVRVYCSSCKKTRDFKEKRKCMASGPIGEIIGDHIASCLWGCNKKRKASHD